ncbi:MAG: hypothetical protein V4581_14420 [Bacteroidota bacterium]
MTLEDVTLDQLYDFMERGSIKNAPQHIVDYVQMLDKIRGMIYRFDIYGNRDMVIKHIVLSYGFSAHKAGQVYNETLEYFYVDAGVSKQAFLNYYADRMEKVANFAALAMKDVNDAAKVFAMYRDLATHREVHVPDKEELPDHFFDKPVNLLSLDASIFEFGNANLKEVESFIDKMPELTEKQKIRIKQEARILPLKLFPNEQEDPRKS